MPLSVTFGRLVVCLGVARGVSGEYAVGVLRHISLTTCVKDMMESLASMGVTHFLRPMPNSSS